MLTNPMGTPWIPETLLALLLSQFNHCCAEICQLLDSICPRQVIFAAPCRNPDTPSYSTILFRDDRMTLVPFLGWLYHQSLKIILTVVGLYEAYCLIPFPCQEVLKHIRPYIRPGNCLIINSLTVQ